MRLVKLAAAAARAANENLIRQLAFTDKLQAEFPDCACDNDSLSEAIDYGGFANIPQTPENLLIIINGKF